MSQLYTPSQRVELGGVSDALRTLWRDCCSEDGKATVSRALTMNLVAVTCRPEEQALRRALDRVFARLPCRAFVVVLDDGAQRVQAEVSGAAQVRGNTRDLVLEQIEIRCPTRWLGNAAGLFRPLLESDIPTHFYWAAALPEDLRPLEALAELADHTVVDSARFREPARDLDRARALPQDQARLSDLGWLRLRPWRHALAEAFEHFAFRNDRPTAVTVRHGQQAGALASALQLAQWLERKLSATVCLEDAAADAHLEAIDIRHGDVTVEACCGEDRQIRVHVTTDAACFLPFAVVGSSAGEGDLLAAAIDMA